MPGEPLTTQIWKTEYRAGNKDNFFTFDKTPYYLGEIAENSWLYPSQTGDKVTGLIPTSTVFARGEINGRILTADAGSGA